MTPSNVQLLKKVREMILAEPRKLNMDVWLDNFRPPNHAGMPPNHAGMPPCGTIGCIAGWALIIHYGDFKQCGHYLKIGDYQVKTGRVGHEAARLLGLDDYEADRLFQHRVVTDYAPGTLGYAEEVVKRIDALIERTEYEHTVASYSS